MMAPYLLGFWTLSIVWCSEQNMFGKLDLFLPTDEKVNVLHIITILGKS
jgi:uncharacterized membrane protein